MNDDEVRPDVIVRTALQQLPVPDHGDDFWNRLDRALDHPVTRGDLPSAPASTSSVVLPEMPPDAGAHSDSADAARPRPASDPSRTLVPAGLRRPSNLVLLAVAAAALVVVGLAGAALLDDRTGGGSDASRDQSLASAELDALIDGAQGADVTLSTMSAADEAASSDAVLAWVDHLQAGAADEAWAAMGPASQAHFASQADFESQLPELAEGYGSWAGTEPDQVLVTAVSDGEEGVLAVVTLVGTTTSEGDPQHRAEAFPVRFLDDVARVEPFASTGELEVVAPPEDLAGDGSRTLASGEELVVVVPGGADTPLLRLDDGETVVCGAVETTELTSLEDAPGQRCAYRPEEGMSTGEHVLTVAFQSTDGAEISAQSMLFDAA